MWSLFMLDPYLSCTYVKIYFIFSNGKEKKNKGGAYVPSCYSWQWPCNQLTSFQTRLSNHRAKRLRSALRTFQPVDVPRFFFILSTFPNLCWHLLKHKKKNTKKKKGHKGEFRWIFLFFFFWSIIFPRQSFFLSITGKTTKKKRNSMCIELVNRQKLYFLFPLEELHFVSKFTDNGFYFGIFSVWELPWGHDYRDAELFQAPFACRALAPRQYWTRSSSCRRVDNEPAFTQHVILYFSASYTATNKPRNRRDVRCVYPL